MAEHWVRLRKQLGKTEKWKINRGQWVKLNFWLAHCVRGAPWRLPFRISVTIEIWLSHIYMYI